MKIVNENLSNKYTYDAKVSPVKEITKTLGAISLNNTLSTTQSCKIKHIMSKLLNSVLQANESSVHDINTITHWISYVFLHETSETR